MLVFIPVLLSDKRDVTNKMLPFQVLGIPRAHEQECPIHTIGFVILVFRGSFIELISRFKVYCKAEIFSGSFSLHFFICCLSLL